MKLLLIFLAFLLVSCNQVSNKKTIDTADLDSKLKDLYSSGEYVFWQNCKACHPLGAMDGFTTRFWERISYTKEKDKWFVQFITNSDSLLQSGDLYTRILKDEYQTDYSHRFSLSSKEINELIFYLRKYERK